MGRVRMLPRPAGGVRLTDAVRIYLATSTVVNTRGSNAIMRVSMGAQATQLHNRLCRIAVSTTFDYPATGTHSWPYWRDELVAGWPVIAQSLGT